MNGVAKYLRLLPAVVIVGTGLLAIKGVDLARAAQAPAEASDGVDNSGLAPADNGGAPVTRDYASDDSTSGSAAEVDVLSNLTRRRAELDARERALNMRENLLAASEGRVDQKIGALKGLQTQIQALLTQRDDAQQKLIGSLIKTYSAMKPKDAARIFNTLSDDVLVPVAKDMKSDVLAPVLAAMNPDAAQKLTVKLATLLKLPDPAPLTCPETPAAAGTSADLTSPVPGTTASVVPPLQTAALSPPGSTPIVSPLPTPPAPPPAQSTPAAVPAATPPAPPPAQASTPPKPHAPPVHHPVTPPPAKPTAAAATPPAKPVASSVPPPVKPATTALTPTVTPPVTPPVPPASMPKPPTQAAGAPPAPLTPAKGG